MSRTSALAVDPTLRALWDEAAALDEAAQAHRREAVEGALRAAHGYEARAAALLGVPRQTLQWWVRTHFGPLVAQLRAEQGYSFGRPVSVAVTDTAQNVQK